MSGGRIRLAKVTAASVAMALVGVLAAVELGRPGTWYGHVYVIIVPPTAQHAPKVPENPLDSSIMTAVDFAGIIAREVGSIDSTKVTVSSQVTLLDEGVPHGWDVRQPTSGSQWEPIFDHPSIEVQATGTSPQEVRARITRIVARIDRTATAREIAAGVLPASRVELMLSPAPAALNYSDGSPGRALVALGLLGGMAVWASFVGTAALLRRPRRSRTRPEGPPPADAVGGPLKTGRPGGKVLTT